MITAGGFESQKIGVFGLGKAGDASITSLAAGGAEIYAWDDRFTSTPSLYDELGNVTCVPPEKWPWAELKALVLSPGIPLTHPKPHAVVEFSYRHHVPVIGDIEILYRSQPEARYIGITGTNGKSTTTTLIGHMLQSAGVKCEVGGNLGRAALSLEPLDKDGVYVLEMSSYQLDLLETMRFNIALFLNLTPDHIDRHGDIEGYIAAKKHIFDRQQKDDVAIIAVDDDYVRAVRDERLRMSEAQVIEVSKQTALEHGVYVKDGVLHDGEYRFDLSPIESLTGAHNWQNAAAAYAVGKAVGLLPAAMYEAFKTFPGLRHRLQMAATINGVRFINDSKATNADATSHALAPYQNIYWIVGGVAKEGGIKPLAPLFHHVKRAYVMGEATDMFANTLEGSVEYTRCETLDKAVQQAAQDAFAERLEGAVVLLSPACASFDQFANFEHRGDVFCELVIALEHNHAV